MTAATGVAFASFGERLVDFVGKAQCRRMDDPEEREAVFRLRYDAYVREGAIAPHWSGRLSDELDDQDNAWIFGVYVDGALASSIRLHVSASPSERIPALNVFSDILGPFAEAGLTIIDPTRFVTDLDASRRHPELPYATVRLAWAACEFFQADLLLATVRTEHQAFYRRVFGHGVACAARDYPVLKKPISLMTLDYQAARERVPARRPFFRSSHFERQMLFERFALPERQAA